MSTNFSLPGGFVSQVNKTIPKKSTPQAREKDTQADFLSSANQPYIKENKKRLMETAETTLKDHGGKGNIDSRLDKEEVRTLLGDKGANKFDDVWNNGFHQEKNTKGDKLIEAQEFFNLFHNLYG